MENIRLEWRYISMDTYSTLQFDIGISFIEVNFFIGNFRFAEFVFYDPLGIDISEYQNLLSQKRYVMKYNDGKFCTFEKQRLSKESEISYFDIEENDMVQIENDPSMKVKKTYLIFKVQKLPSVSKNHGRTLEIKLPFEICESFVKELIEWRECYDPPERYGLDITK